MRLEKLMSIENIALISETFDNAPPEESLTMIKERLPESISYGMLADGGRKGQAR